MDYTYKFDVTAWGWFHIILGAIGLATGIGVVVGQTWARLVGIAIAGLAMITNFMWLPHYPVYAVVILALDVAVMWGIISSE